MDLGTDDHRAWALAPHLMVVRATESTIAWMDPETGTTCELDTDGEYVVMRRVLDHLAPVVGGQIPPDHAAWVFEDPETVRARRAVAHAIVAVDVGVRARYAPTG